MSETQTHNPDHLEVLRISIGRLSQPDTISVPKNRNTYNALVWAMKFVQHESEKTPELMKGRRSSLKILRRRVRDLEILNRLRSVSRFKRMEFEATKWIVDRIKEQSPSKQT